MFKVVFVLKTVVIRLKECPFEVVVRKKHFSVPLALKHTISNGFANVNHTSQFYVSAGDPTLRIQIILHLGHDRKLGGEIDINLLQYEPNVVHNNISNLTNSPDKQGRTAFTFYYFEDQEVVDERPIFLAKDRHHPLYQEFIKQNTLLSSENNQLEQELKCLTHKKEKLEGNKKYLQEKALREERQQEKLKREEAANRQHQQEIDNSKLTAERLMHLMRSGGLDRSMQPQ